jgi:Amidase
VVSVTLRHATSPNQSVRTTSSSLAYKDFVPEEDDVVVERLCAGKAVMIGKTNTPEFGNSQSATTFADDWTAGSPTQSNHPGDKDGDVFPTAGLVVARVTPPHQDIVSGPAPERPADSSYV